MLEEFENLMRNGVLAFEKRTPGIKVVPTKWTFKAKCDEQGKIVRHKACLVALGNLQTQGVDFDKTYSPVVKSRTTRILLALAAEKGWDIEHVDIVAAFLAAPLKERIYIHIPDGLLDFCDILREKYPQTPTREALQKGGWVCRLLKCIYGLRQSGKEWNERLDVFLKTQNLTRSKADPCLYFDLKRELFVTTYMDDNSMYGKSQEISKLKEAMAHEFEICDLGTAKYIQSIRITYDKRKIRIDQSMYATEVLKRFKMEQCKPISTPMVPGEYLTKSLPSEILDVDRADEYRTLVGSLLYLAMGTRPDLAYTATYLSQFSSAPAERHWRAAKHAL